ncbi:MAG: hypothetical protein U0736_11890 [Gemmataceae bacterium]
MNPSETIHYTQLPAAEAGSQIATEWDTYRREVGRLLREGHEGRFALIKGEQVIGLFATLEEARTAGYHRFLAQPFLIQQVRAHEPLYRHSRYQPCPT